MQAAEKSTDSECDALISITWILELINGALVYGVLLLNLTRRKGLERERQKGKTKQNRTEQNEKNRTEERKQKAEEQAVLTSSVPMSYKASNLYILFSK